MLGKQKSNVMEYSQKLQLFAFNLFSSIAIPLQDVIANSITIFFFDH